MDLGDPTDRIGRPLGTRVLIGLEIFDAIGGFVGGIPFLLDPSGSLLGVSVSMFPGLPVSDFLLVGLWLTAIYGIGSCLVAVLLWRRHRWAVSLAAIGAAVWLGWVALEVVVWGASSFIVPWLVPPLAVFALVALPAVRAGARSRAAEGSS